MRVTGINLLPFNHRCDLHYRSTYFLLAELVSPPPTKPPAIMVTVPRTSSTCSPRLS
ncbi:G patch domain-containing protein 3 [Sesbania bispinosa]|nr:G patch domain-containing protein 3 [Sesbania bispinosa]